LKGEVESDEIYITAGCKGNNHSRPAHRAPRRRGFKYKRGRGTYETDKTPILGLASREGDIYMQTVRNVKTETIRPIIETVVAPHSNMYTDDYSIYNFLDRSDNYTRKIVCHSKGEYAIALNEEGTVIAHTNTQEGIWSLLRPWIRPHRGINKKYLPLYIAPCEYFLRNRDMTPAQQIRRVIHSAVSFTGYLVKEAYKSKILLPLCSV
jgi:transposase-like protein